MAWSKTHVSSVAKRPGRTEEAPEQKRLWLWRLAILAGGFVLSAWLGVGAAVVSLWRDSALPEDGGGEAVRLLTLDELREDLEQQLEAGVEAEIEARFAQRSED